MHSQPTSSPGAVVSEAPPNQSTQRRHLPQVLAALTLLFSLLLTYGLWNNAERSVEENMRREFDFRVGETTEQIVRRMETYQQVLRATRGFLRDSMHVRRDEFHAYVETLGVNEYFPGIQGIGIAEIVPTEQKDQHVAAVRNEGFSEYAIRPFTERDFYTAITRIEPFNQMNLRALGYDMFSEPIRRAAMERARDSGAPALSGKVTLVQESQTDIQPGVLLYLPVYRKGISAATLEQRRASILGWVYAPFRINDFMAGMGGARSTDLYINMYDGEEMSQHACLFGCSSARSSRSLLTTTEQINIAGRVWTIDMASTPAFEARTTSEAPRLIAGGGILASVLLALVVWILASGRSRAQALAMEMTRELRLSHQQSASEQQRMKVILHTSHDAFIAINGDGLVTDWNIQAERTFGWTANEAIGKRMADLIIPQDQRDAHVAGFQRFTVSGTGPAINNRIEVMALHRSGKVFPVEMAVAAIKRESGYVASAFIRDLTHRKEAEEREAKHQQALEETRTALQHAQRLEAVGKLTGGIAHDFNNVLQIISGNIQLLMHDIGTSEHREKRLQSALKAVDRGSKLSSQLLAFARRQPLQPQVVNVRRLLSNMDDLLRRALGAEIEIETIVSGGLWNTLIDPNQLENVILNLAINARDAMKTGGKLTIELGNALLDDEYAQPLPDVPPGQYVMLAVSDNGEGMSAEVMEHAFEPFFTTKPEGEGTGLGLSMAYGFVKQSGGHIRIYSEVGHGTTVKIYLPRALGAEQNVHPATPANVVGGDETILVVEDDASLQATVVATLSELGYRVLKAHDGASALEIIKNGEAVDLLFTDVVMPGPVRSTELAKEAKTCLPNVAVLFTSGYTQNAIVHGGRLDPGVNLISKPYRREQLARKIRQVLNEQSY